MKLKLQLILLLALSFSLNAQTPRMVLVEEFTQASCGPCAQQNPAFDALLEMHEDKAVVLKYQTSWPGFDPMNLQNPDDVATRVSYYGVSGVPNAVMDGNQFQGAPSGVTLGGITSRQDFMSPVSMALDHTLSDDLKKMTITLDVTNTLASELSNSNLRLRVAVIEKDIAFPSAPGSNGEDHFNSVMRTMIGGAAGLAIDNPMAAGETVPFSWEVDIPSYIYTYAEIGVVAFIQNDGTKEVLQSAISYPKALVGEYVDGALTNSFSYSDNFCNPTVSASAVLTNNGTKNITKAEVGMVINGNIGQVVMFEGDLAPGQSETLNFDDVDLATGFSTFYTGIASLNDGETDVSTFDQLGVQDSKSVFGSYAEMNGTFEGLPFNDEGDFIVASPHGLSFVNVEAASFGTGFGPVGGYAESNNSLIIDYWTWDPSVIPDPGYMYFGEIDMSGYTNSQITFDKAGMLYTASDPDRLDLEVSTDCGDTWTAVWGKQGSELSTNGTKQDGRFIPQLESEWSSEAVDMSAYDGMSNVSIRFKATSGYGNSLYIDNIVLSSVSSTEDVYTGSYELSPNPAVDYINFSIDSESNLDYNLNIMTIDGRLAKRVVNNGTLSTGTNNVTIDVSDLNSGMYLLQFVSEEGSFIEKINKI